MANRDEDVFGPDSEEIERRPATPYDIAFGCGEHSRIGAQLARLEATVMFEELLGRFPATRAGREVYWNASHHGAAGSSGCRYGGPTGETRLDPRARAAARRDRRRPWNRRRTRNGQAAVSERTEGGTAVRDCVRALGQRPTCSVSVGRVWRWSAIEQFIFAEEARRVNVRVRR